MKKISIYEPAMCCPTGLCGVAVDPDLLRMSTVINNLRKNRINFTRFNLTSAPQAFMKNSDVTNLVNQHGIEILPVTVLDGQVVKQGAYPTNAEIAQWLDVSESMLSAEDKESTVEEQPVMETVGAGGGCCPGGDCC